MARGWESKHVEAQMEESVSRKPANLEIAPTGDDVQTRMKKSSLQLSRSRILQQLEQSSSERYSELLRRTLADLDSQLS